MTNPNDEPLKRYAKIVENLENIARKHGLYLQGSAVVPSRDEDGPVFLQVSFLVGEIAVDGVPAEVETEDPELLEAFNDIISGSKKAEEESEMERIKREFNEGKGIFEGF